MGAELHSDLLRCEHCGQHNKVLNFCSACGRARTQIIVVRNVEYRKNVARPYWCAVCLSQSDVKGQCPYCSGALSLNIRNVDFLSRLTQKERDFLTNRPPQEPQIFPEKPSYNELHIDLLRCEHCGQHNKLLNFCSACHRPRTSIIVAQPHEYRSNVPSKWRCKRCSSQSDSSGHCSYCNRGMVRNDVALFVDPNEEVKVEAVPSTSQKKRDIVYSRDGGCLRCRTTSSLSLHHIVHAALGGTNKTNNLQTLCEPCHAYLHNVLGLPSGTPYSLDEDPNPPMLTQEQEDAQWNLLRRKRFNKHGKKPHTYDYGKQLSTNLAAPMIKRLREEAKRPPSA